MVLLASPREHQYLPFNMIQYKSMPYYVLCRKTHVYMCTVYIASTNVRKLFS